MNITATVIMGILMIATLVTFARTNWMGKNNLFNLLLIAIAVVASVAWNLMSPTWWALAILAYGMTVLYHVLRDKQNSLISGGEVSKYSRKKLLIMILHVLIACAIVTFGVLCLIKKWTWYTAIVWLPLIALGIGMFFGWVHYELSKI